MSIQFKYTMPGISQQNVQVEQKFATLLKGTCAMLNGRNFSSFLRNKLWTEAASTTNLLENKLLTPTRDLSPFQHHLGRKEKYPYLDANIW